MNAATTKEAANGRIGLVFFVTWLIAWTLETNWTLRDRHTAQDGTDWNDAREKRTKGKWEKGENVSIHFGNVFAEPEYLYDGGIDRSCTGSANDDGYYYSLFHLLIVSKYATKLDTDREESTESFSLVQSAVVCERTPLWSQNSSRLVFFDSFCISKD